MKCLPALVLMLPLAACGGNFFVSKAAPPSAYRLSGLAQDSRAAAAIAATPADLAILKPRVRPGLDTDRIAALYPDRRLEYFAGARWSGPLDEVIEYLAVQSFHSHANLRSVGVDASAFARGYWLEIEVSDFQAEYESGAAAPTVHVRFQCRVGSARDARILGGFETSAKQAAADNRVAAIVDAFERAADAALAELVAHAAETLNENPEAR